MKKEGSYRLTRHERCLLRSVRNPIATDDGERLTKPCVICYDRADMGVICCYSLSTWRKFLRTIPGFDTCYVFELVNIC